MEKNRYTLAGEVNVPDDKKEELNGYVLELLDKCGIRKTEEIELDGKVITVVDRVRPDKNGVVSFDYSIFEKKKRAVGTYDMATCKLFAPDRGLNEFGLAMNLIMILQESYTNGTCYMMEKDKPLTYTEGYLSLLKSLLGREFKLQSRTRVWEMFLYFRNNYNSITKMDILDGFPWKCAEVDEEQLAALFCMEADLSELTDEEKEYERSEIENMTLQERKKYLCQIFRKLIVREHDELRTFLKELLEGNVEKRKELAVCDNDYGIIAELSLYVLPSIVVGVFAAVKGNEFWDEWHSFEIKGYDDTVINKEKMEKWNIREIPFYRAIRRNSEDEFLEFWDGNNLLISDSLLECLEDWKKRYEGVTIPSDMQTERYLSDIVEDLKKDWNCRLVDKKFVTEFTENKDVELYKRTLVLFREIMDGDLVFFPELTRRQAIDWVIKRNRNRFDFIAMSAYQSLMVNHKQRMELYGF